MKTVAFDPTFLNTDDEKTVDLSRFAYGSSGIPGVYKTAMYVNDQFINKKDIELRARNDKSIYPCLSTEVLKSITFNYDKLPDNFFNQSNVEGCIDLQQYLPEAKVNYDSNEQRLDIVIPQLYMLKVARGTVSPQLWDSGIPALLLGYNINGYHSEMKNQQFNSLYAGINAGLNIGSWYLRHNGSYSSTNNGPDSYGTINTYLQHDVPLLKARMLIGQSNTNGDLFDTLPFSGVQMVTDERMLPESLRGYAPEIQGIARTNARVTVRQGELVLYETTVTPGVFLINDLYPTGYGGDLNVTVREADGTEQRFNVPYSSVAQLLRPGSSRYAITAGKLRNDNVREKPMVYQATWQHGLTNALTGYGGAQFSQNYYAVQLGAAVGTPVGAVSFDITQAHARLGEEEWRNNTRSGQSYQVSYSKLIREINSNISLAAYRFSTDGYMDIIVPMGSYDANQDFDGVGSTTGWIKTNLELKNCPAFYGFYDASNTAQLFNWDQGGASHIPAPTSNTIGAYFAPNTAIVDSANGIMSIDTSAPSSASGVGIQLGWGDGAPVPFNLSVAQILTLPRDGRSNVSVPLYARYIQTDGIITPGRADGKVTFTISYY
ncbi:TPA: fimbria/pilus outer membrane usher protein [Salmonella enterica]|nr:hypothetical protein [Salmonella enterica]EJQ0713140.1 fimbria/pilus outer membrane usher protein [Salmonella enterica]HDY3113370.1 fimbria/pilus outer membrane usher protein [Salmonella enterica]